MNAASTIVIDARYFQKIIADISKNKTVT